MAYQTPVAAYRIIIKGAPAQPGGRRTAGKPKKERDHKIPNPTGRFFENVPRGTFSVFCSIVLFFLKTMDNVTPSTVGEEKRLKGSMNPLSGNDAELERADADDGRKETPGALGMMAGSEFSEPIGAVDMFGPDATPNEHENSKDWADDVKGNESEVAEGETSKGAAPEEGEEESPGAALTSLSNTAN